MVEQYVCFFLLDVHTFWSSHSGQLTVQNEGFSKFNCTMHFNVKGKSEGINGIRRIITYSHLHLLLIIIASIIVSITFNESLVSKFVIISKEQYW